MNFNRVILGGRLTRDVDLRKTGSGTSVANIGFACNRKVKRGEEWIDEPVFVDVTMFGRRAEVLAERFKKGSPVLFEGELCLDQWEDKETGEKRQKLKVIADSFEFVGGKSDLPF